MSTIIYIDKPIKDMNEYKDFYIIANSFDDAERKLIQQLTTKQENATTSNIFTEDGSLKPEIVGIKQHQTIIVRTIEFLTDEIT